jgi:hypothetical protein
MTEDLMADLAQDARFAKRNAEPKHLESAWNIAGT